MPSELSSDDAPPRGMSGGLLEEGALDALLDDPEKLQRHALRRLLKLLEMPLPQRNGPQAMQVQSQIAQFLVTLSARRALDDLPHAGPGESEPTALQRRTG